MHTKLADNYNFCAEDIIKRLRNGEEHLRGFLIESYQNYILSLVSKMIGKPAKSSDEYSIALQAFNEAIDSYDMKKNVTFINFASMVMNRRIIDHIRKVSKFNNEYPFTYFEVNDNEEYIDTLISEQPNIFTQKIEMQEEILRFNKKLKRFGITLDDLTKNAPKHKDTKLMCISIAKKISEDEEMSKKLEKDKRLPVSKIMSCFKLSRNTLDNHRKYIIALYLILNSNMDVIKGYISFLTKGV